MKDEILRMFENFEKEGWITLNPQINRKIMAQVFVNDLFKGMTVRKFLEIFNIEE